MKILSKIQEDIDFNYEAVYWGETKPDKDVITLQNNTAEGECIRGCVDEKHALIDLKISHGLWGNHTKRSQTIETGETTLVINIPFSNNYGHCLHDVLPKLLWADKNSKYDKIYTRGSPMIESLVDLFDIQFKKTIFVNQDFAIHSENVILENHRPRYIRETKKNKILKEIIDEKSSKLKTCPKKLLIYCSRNHSGDVRHGRLMNQNNEDTIIKLLQEYCHDNDLMFHLFSGQENGKTMSHKKQFELFRCAKIVVGPHGSAMANIVYLDFKNKPKICEFTSGTQVQVHAGLIFAKHYYALHGYIFDDNQYYLIPYTKDSTSEVTSIDIDNLKQFLEETELMNEEIFTTLVGSAVTLQWSLERINYLLANKNLNKSGYSPDKNINYFDLGTHEKAVELNWVADHVLAQLPNPYKIFAFEANPNSYNLAIDNCNQIDNLKFHNIALVSKIPESGSVKLYVYRGGKGDSIYREQNNYIEVEAKKLSDVIRDEDVRLNESINIIRMNIEGCEYDVIEDLIEADLIKYFDGFYGMWDDVFKLDKEKYGKFQKILKEINVYPFPFNGRDMQREKRKALINESLMNSILGYKFGY